MNVILILIALAVLAGGTFWYLCWDAARYEKAHPGFGERLARLDEELDRAEEAQAARTLKLAS